MFCAATGRECAQRQAERIAKEGRRPVGFVLQSSGSTTLAPLSGHVLAQAA